MRTRKRISKMEKTRNFTNAAVAKELKACGCAGRGAEGGEWALQWWAAGPMARQSRRPQSTRTRRGGAAGVQPDVQSDQLEDDAGHQMDEAEVPAVSGQRAGSRL